MMCVYKPTFLKKRYSFYVWTATTSFIKEIYISLFFMIFKYKCRIKIVIEKIK